MVIGKPGIFPLKQASDHVYATVENELKPHINLLASVVYKRI